MKVLCFGSLNIDYVYSVDQFVRKGETISSTSLEVFPGGKGMNQSIALSRARAKVFHAGVIGKDGLFLKEELDRTGVDTRFLQVSEEVRTGNAIIQRDSNGDNCIILYGGSNKAITREMADQVLSNFEPGDYLLLQNEINELPYIVEKAHEVGMKIVFNPSPCNSNIFRINLDHVDCFILNEIEGQMMVRTCAEKDALIEKLRQKYPNTEVVLTLGEQGSVYFNKDTVVKQKAYLVETVDTTAAGDTFTGYYIAGRLSGMDVRSVLDMAAKAAAIAVSRKGASVSIPTMEEVLQFDQ